MGKFYVLSAAIKAEYYWLAVIGVLNSVVAVYYYLRVIMYMYFREPAGEISRPDFSPAYTVVIAISLWALFHMGIFPRGFSAHRPEIGGDFHVDKRRLFRAGGRNRDARPG